jgi:ABC-type transport system involved in multi-copper enzyme maturation permease subunit
VLSTLWTIAKNALVEVIRQPVYAILLAMGLALIAFSPAITMFTMAEDEKMMIDMGLATMLMLGVVMAVLGASQVISREIESETAGAVLSKPVGRLTFVVGKFIGVSMATFQTSLLLGIMLMTAVRMGVPSSESFKMDYPALLAELLPALAAIGLGMYANYFFRWNFTSTAMVLAVPFYCIAFLVLLVVGPNWNLELIPQIFVQRHTGQLAVAVLLVALGVWVLSAVAVAASTRLNVVMSAIVCLAVFFTGMISQFLFGQYAGHSIIAWTAQRLVPNLEVFWVGDQLMQEAPFVPPTYVAMAGAYAVAFTCAMVVLAAFLFERREVV